MLSSFDLVQRCEETDVLFGIGFAETLLHLKPESQAAFLQIGGGCCVFAGEGSPLNKAMGMGMHGPVSASDFTQIEEFFLSRNTVPHIDCSRMPIRRFSSVSMSVNIGSTALQPHLFFNLNSSLRQNFPTELSFGNHVPKKAEIWMETLNRGFTESGTIPPVFADIALVDFYHPSVRRFIAEINGVPAGAGCLAIINNTATFFGTSTLAPFRRHGVQTALLHHRLHIAREAGCDLVRVIARPGSNSQRNIERFGFHMVDIRARFARPTS